MKWAGGKRQLVPHLLGRLPHDFEERRYVEPFLGAGSLFFASLPRTALLADSNEFLIAAFEAVKEKPALVRKELAHHIANHSEDHYYKTREQFNQLQHSFAQSARFLYLNKACFNGIFRVNLKGQFNVPKGSRTVLQVPPLQTFLALSTALSHATLLPGDFVDTLEMVVSKDFVYLDPPYPALTDTANFRHYTAQRFGAEMQAKLANRVARLDTRGAKFLMSNADVPLVRQLYSRFRIEQIPVMRFVSANGKRIRVPEVVVSNY